MLLISTPLDETVPLTGMLIEKSSQQEQQMKNEKEIQNEERRKNERHNIQIIRGVLKFRQKQGYAQLLSVRNKR